MKSTVFFEKGSVWKAIFKMSLPTIAVMLVTIVYNMADLIFVGQTGDAAQVAAVSLASPFFLLQMTLGTVANIVLDPLFICGFGMGVQGGARYGSARRRACCRVAVSSKKTAGCACPVK